jgi:hypothetical protein
MYQQHRECRDPLCSHPNDTNADPIYRAHRALHARLASKVAPVLHPFAQQLPAPVPQGWSTEKKVLVGVGVAVVALGVFGLGPKILGAIAAA